MNQERIDKITEFLSKKREEGKMNMDLIISVMKEVDRKAKLECYEHILSQITEIRTKLE